MYLMQKEPTFPPSATLELYTLILQEGSCARVGLYLEGRSWWATLCTTSSVKYTILLKFAVQRSLVYTSENERFQKPRLMLTLRRCRP